MTDSVSEGSQAPGWGITWSSWEVRRKYFALAFMLTLCSSLGVVAGIVITGSMLGPEENGALVAGLVAAGAVTALYVAFFGWLRPQISNGDDFGRVAKTASKIDTCWFTAWVTVIIFLPLLITVPIIYSFDLKPFSGIYALLFGNILAVNLSPLTVMALRGPDAPPLGTPTKDDEVHHAKRIETGMLVYAFAVLFLLLAMTGALLVYFTSRLA